MISQFKRKMSSKTHQSQAYNNKQNITESNSGGATSNNNISSGNSSFEFTSIKFIAESVGISNMSDEACKDLASDLTFTLKSLIIDSQKFARRSRRNTLVSSDIDYALKVRLIEPVYGFHTTDPAVFKSTTMTGGNSSGRSIVYTEDQMIDLNDVIAVNNKSIKLPNDFVINAHWLAIDGIQPSVPENPELFSRELQKKEAVEGVSKSKEKLLQQLQQRHQKDGENLVKLKSLLPHDLSMEQQIYFKEITEACVGSDEQKRTEALNSLSSDPGLHQLLPRFIIFISEGVRLNISQFNMAILIYLMRIAKSLIDNKSIYLEKYLHELLPSILSCQLSKQLCARPEQDNHFALREFCARLIGQIVKTYTPTLTPLQNKIVKIYLKSMQSDKTSFSTLFGAIVGFAELGNEICESFVFPLVRALGERITQILDSPATNQEKLPAEKIKTQLTEIVSNVLIEKPPQSSNEFDYLTTEFGAYFGQLIHSQVMKLRSQRIHYTQSLSSTTFTKTIVANSNKLNNMTAAPSKANQSVPSRPIVTEQTYLSSASTQNTKTNGSTVQTFAINQNSSNEASSTTNTATINNKLTNETEMEEKVNLENTNMSSSNLSLDLSLNNDKMSSEINFDDKLMDQSVDDLFF